jgi:hypothetical protein
MLCAGLPAVPSSIAVVFRGTITKDEWFQVSASTQWAAADVRDALCWIA